MTPAASSTMPEAAEVASATLAPDPKAASASATAIDAVIAGVLTLAAHVPSVFLGSITILLGGTGEGSFAIDGRAKQPGLGATRPRGFLADGDVPLAARIASPGLPAALALAHAGRGARTLSQLVHSAIASAQAVGAVREERAESLRTFGRLAGTWLRSGPIADSLLAEAARSAGGLLTAEDLEQPPSPMLPTTLVTLSGRSWGVAPWAEHLIDALTHEGSHSESHYDSPQDSLRDSPHDSPHESTNVGPGPVESVSHIEIVSAIDARGAAAIAAVMVAHEALPLRDTGLEAPLLASPVMRGVTRKRTGAPIEACSPIAIGRPIESSRVGPVDLALGLGGASVVARGHALAPSNGDLERAFALILKDSSVPMPLLEHSFGMASGVAVFSTRGNVIAPPRAR